MGRDGTEPKSSRIFHQCYLNCCKLQNLTPLTSVIPSGNGKVVDFCVDRIKYADWPPILNALSCDLSLHTVAIKCRQQVKTVLEHIDCERLAKTVNKRCVVLTKFMLSNLVEAVAQLLSNTTLLTTLWLEGFPLRIPYLNPLCQALTVNGSVQHLHLHRCLIGDAGCLALCTSIKTVLLNMATLDLSGCELTPLGAGYIADLVKFQKIHRYSENWTHTLRYRLPELDSMGGLRRITICENPQLGDEGVGKLLDVLSDDLWIKALDIQNCGLTEKSTAAILQMLTSNKTLVVIDMRCNGVCLESLSKVRSTLRDNERGAKGQFSWLASVSRSSSERLLKSIASKTGIPHDRTTTNLRAAPTKYVSNPRTGQKQKDYADSLEEQLQAEISHRQQLEELNRQLVDQLKQMKLQMTQLWSNSGRVSSGSEPSLEASVSGDLSSSSGSESPISLDQHTVSYVQQAFKDIYKFIKNNQCPGVANGQCIHEALNASASNNGNVLENICGEPKPIEVIEEVEEPAYSEELRINIGSRRPQSSHTVVDKMRVNKTTKSAHLLGDLQRVDVVEMKLNMIERQMGDTVDSHREESTTLEDTLMSIVSKPNNKKNTHGLGSPCSSVVSESDTLTYSPQITQRSVNPPLVNPRDVLYSSSDEDES